MTHRNNKTISRHDSVELPAESDDYDYQQVLGIISIMEITSNSENCIATLIIGAQYEKSQKTKNSKLMPYQEIKYKFIPNRNLEITIFEIDYVSRPLCVIPQRPTRSKSVEEQLDLSCIRQLRMWCFDLAYIDRTSWENYADMFISHEEDVNEDNENNGINYLLTRDQLERHAIRRSEDNERIQEGKEIFP